MTTALVTVPPYPVSAGGLGRLAGSVLHGASPRCLQPQHRLNELATWSGDHSLSAGDGQITELKRSGCYLLSRCVSGAGEQPGAGGGHNGKEMHNLNDRAFFFSFLNELFVPWLWLSALLFFCLNWNLVGWHGWENPHLLGQSALHPQDTGFLWSVVSL